MSIKYDIQAYIKHSLSVNNGLHKCYVTKCKIYENRTLIIEIGYKQILLLIIIIIFGRVYQYCCYVIKLL